MKLPMKRVAKLVTFGVAGDTAYFGTEGGAVRCVLTGHGSPERPHAGEPDERAAFPDGTPALNLLPALETDDGVLWALHTPMVDPDLKPGQVRKCPRPDPMFSAAMDGTPLGSLLTLHTSDPLPGPLDSVSVEDYITGWVARGAVRGEYRSGTIIWENHA